MTITQLAWTTYHACKNAAGEYHKLSDEVKNLHIALDRLKDEAEKPGSLVRLDIERHSRTTRRIWCNCDDVLREVDEVIHKHESLGTNKKKLRDRLQFSAKDLGDIRSKIAAHTNVINVYIGIVGLSSLGRLEQQSHIDSDRLFEIQEKIDKLATEFRVGKREGSILTTYPNDHKETWKAFRRSLLSDGITSDSLIRYGPEIKAYLMQLTKNGMLDEQAYDSDGNQEGLDNEPTTNHFIKPAGVSEKPSEPFPSRKINRISRVKVSALPQPEQKKAVELTSALSEPAVNQRLSNMDSSSPNHSQSHHHPDGEDRGFGTGPFTRTVERDSPLRSTPNAITRPVAESILVPIEAASDENSETSSVGENSLLTFRRPALELKPDPMVKPVTDVESDSMTTISTERLDICPRTSTSDSLHAGREPSIQKDHPTSSEDKTTRDNVTLVAVEPPVKRERRRERIYRREKERERDHKVYEGRTRLTSFSTFFLISSLLCVCMQSRRT